MSEIFSDASAAMLDGFDGFVNTGSGTAKFTLYQTNTSLAVFNLSNPAFGSAVGPSLVLSGCPISSTGTEVAGTANWFDIVNRNGELVYQGTVSAVGGGGDIETPNLTVTAAETQTLNALVLRMGSAGELTVEGSLTLV
jgi:hypothetical protein